MCGRCERRIDVGPAPRQWCPLCRGVLLSPVAIGRPPGRFEPPRNFRWTASAPPSGRPRRSRPAAPGPTPSYAQTPTWGLPMTAPAPPPERTSASDRFAARAPMLLRLTAVLFVAAALAELARYGLLLVSRTSLIGPVVLALSDAAVWSLGVVAVGFGLVTAVSAVGWLIRARADAFATTGRTDPRRRRTIYLGSLIPVVNLVMPGVFLTEFARASPHRLRVEKVVPRWWLLWVLDWILLTATALLRLSDGIQARANGVLLSMLTDLVAAALAMTTLAIVHRSQDRTLTGSRRSVTRWTVVPPARPVAATAETSEATETVEPTDPDATDGTEPDGTEPDGPDPDVPDPSSEVKEPVLR